MNPTRGTFKTRVQVEDAGPPTPDGNGGFTENWIPLEPPDWWCSIENASARNMERQISKTIEATATHVLRGDYHPQMMTTCRILAPDRDVPSQQHRYDVLSVQTVDDGRRYMVVTAAEYISRPRGL